MAVVGDFCPPYVFFNHREVIISLSSSYVTHMKEHEVTVPLLKCVAMYSAQFPRNTYVSKCCYWILSSVAVTFI